MIDQGRAMDAREEAVTQMANAAWNGSSDLKITHNQYDGIARKMLDALLSGRVEKGPIAYLAGELEQVGRGVEYEDDMTGATHTTIGFNARNYVGTEFAVYRLPTQSGSTQP